MALDFVRWTPYNPQDQYIYGELNNHVKIDTHIFTVNDDIEVSGILVPNIDIASFKCIFNSFNNGYYTVIDNNNSLYRVTSISKTELETILEISIFSTLITYTLKNNTIFISVSNSKDDIERINQAILKLQDDVLNLSNSLNNKIDKVNDAIPGHIAVFSAAGEIEDSGESISDLIDGFATQILNHRY